MYGEKYFSDMDADEKIANLNERLEKQINNQEKRDKEINAELRRSNDEVMYWRDLFRCFFLDNNEPTDVVSQMSVKELQRLRS